MINIALRQVEEIFHEALSLDGLNRSEYLDSACSDDHQLRKEVESLISAYESSGALLDDSAVTLALKVMGTDAVAPMAGKELGRYRILDRLGRGGMGDVYLAEDRRLNRKVALKFLSNEFVTDTWAKRKLVKEAQAVAKLDHPNICAVYGYDEIDNHSFIVMQFIEGETLADLIRRKSLDAEKIVTLAHQIVSALAAAHAHGIIHRDIKPKNIMVTPSSQVKVLDFGLAKTTPKSIEDVTESISQLSRDGVLVGTIAYMSPEQLRGERLDYRSDIFSLGTVLYEMACGKNPHAPKPNTPNAEIISAIIRGQTPPIRGLSGSYPKGLEHIVSKCLQKDRSNRYQSSAELLLDLNKVQSGVRLPAPRQSFPMQYAAVASLLLLTLMVALYAYSAWADSRPTLAVLPIVCDEPTSQCPGPAFTANLIRALSRRNGLNVRSSQIEPALFGPQASSPEKVGRDLNADMVLYGRISRGEKGLVLTIRVVRVKDGSRLAEEPFPLNPNKTGIEQWISLQTAALLQLPMNEDDRTLFNALAAQQNESPDAVRLYLLGRAQWLKRDFNDVEKPLASFKQATEKDPLFAPAWAGLADCYVLKNTVAFEESGKDSMMKAEAAARKALELDDSLAEAHNAYAAVLMKGRWDWEGAEREFQRAIALSPDYSPAHWGYSTLLATTGRFNESVAEAEKARALDPFHGPSMLSYCRALHFARRTEETSACHAQLAQEHPNYSGGKYSFGIKLALWGRVNEAIPIFEEFYAKNKKLGAMLGYCYGMANRREDALRVLREMQELDKERPLPPQEFAIIYLGLNDIDRAMALFRQAVEEKYPPSQTIFIDPMFDRLRGDPRFVALAREVRLPVFPPTSAGAPTTAAK